MDKIFYLDDTPTIEGKMILCVNHKKFYCKGTSGSYNLLAARLLNISYANYLRLCRDVCGAEIYGKNCRYPVAYFDFNEQTHALVELLNKLANQVIFNRTHPDYQAHKDLVDKIYKEAYQDEYTDLISWREQNGKL